MTSSAVLETVEPATVGSQPNGKQAFTLVFSCTLIGALAQILIKQGTAQLGAHATLADVARHPALIVSFFLGILVNFRLFLGYCFYGINTILMALALKGRELSKLYPIIALTYVWVTILSVFFLVGEHINFFRGIGIAFIVGGVSVLGRSR